MFIQSYLELLLVLFIAQVLSLSCHEQPENEKCLKFGCFYEKIENSCKPCQDCSEEGLRKEFHRPECRDMDFPRYCPRPAGDNIIPTEMLEIHLASQLFGNFSQNNGKWIIFFYNEIAEEGKQDNYARVGKVCSHEWEKDKSQWNTFQKTRVLCQSASGVEFNYLADIKMIGEEYYGIFTERRKGSTTSALCVLSPDKIKIIMQSKNFCDPIAIPNGERVELRTRNLPSKKPGRCQEGNLTTWETVFIRTHSLMFEVVENSSPLLTASGHFTILAYHTKITPNLSAYTLFFIGTEDGKILKFLETDDGRVNFLESITLTPEAGEIMAIEVSKNGSTLEIISKQNAPISIPLHRCSQMSNCSCPQDPYCVWNAKESMCQEFNNFTSGEEFNQSVAICHRNGIDEPLLVSNHSLIIPTTQMPEIEEPRKSQDDDEIHGVNISKIVPLVASVLIAVLLIVVGLLLYGRSWFNRIYSPGPSVVIQLDSITTSSVSVIVSDMDENFSGLILMKPSREYLRQHEKHFIANGSIIKMDGLVPNSEYKLHIILANKTGGYGKEPFIKNLDSVKTKMETFQIERRSGEDFLVWSDIDKRITKVTLRGCCFSAPAPANRSDGCLLLGELPDIENMQFKVIAEMKIKDSSVQHQVADSVYDNRKRETLGLQVSSCNKKLSFLTGLEIVKRIKLVEELAVDHSIYSAYCKALGYGAVETDAFYQQRRDADDKFLQPLIERNGEDEPLIEVLRELEKTFNMSLDNDFHQQVYRVMTSLVKLHDDCPACNLIYRRVHHKHQCMAAPL